MTETVPFPQDRTCPYEPAPGYRTLAERRPISQITLYDGRKAWAVTGHELTRRLLTDPRISSDRTNPDWPMVSAAAAVEFNDVQQKVIKLLTALVGVDGPKHRARRKLAQAGFTVRRVDSMRPKIQEIVDRRLDAMLEHGAPADLASMFASPVPLMAVCETLGIPHEEQEYFERKAHQILFGPDAAAAYDELMAYLGKLIEKARQSPAESFLKDLLAERGEADDVEQEEVLQMFLIILVTGHDTTSSSIALGAYTLLRHPERLAELRADPSLWPAAVDELTRLVAVPDGLQRVAAEDIEVDDDTTIHEGDGVFFLFSLINRDEDAYERPETLDWHRPRFRDHLTYGFGPHQCVGMNLARVIMEIAFRTLFERLPDLRLAVPADEVPIKPGEAFQGLVELPVTW
ncbi:MULTISPECIES: cytochrome P450 [Actinomadura]|uniref:cytochrome P450 n=1 Tax=Actinomadura TaxID=1988 RepID=UPI000426199C|nr:MULTISPECIES: cytochrome P450 [Actinomadura]RSN55643.1 cytochrome P450 [Actinomadura sp. WAC 06369]